MQKRIVILVSGAGSNAQAIIEDCAAGKINGKVVAVISNRPDAYALERAKNANIEAICLDHKVFSDREEFDNALLTRLISLRPDLLVLAGFMRILGPEFVQHFEGKMLNIHPSLLPNYPGLNTHQRAIDNSDALHGASVHFVTAELDGGPVVIQSQIRIEPSDTAETLTRRVAQTEWHIYPEAVRWFCDGRLKMQSGRVCLDNKTLPKSGIIYDTAKV